jgi:SSS family transporter
MTNRRPTLAAWIAVVSLCCIALAQDSETRNRLKWSEVAPLPQAMSGHFVGVVDGALVVVGGSYFEVSPWQGGNKIWLNGVYFLGGPDGTWSEADPLPHALAYGGMGSVAKGLILAGGSDGQRHYATTFLLTKTGDGLVLKDLPNLPKPCAMSGAAVLGNTVYLAGGQIAPDSTEALHTFWALDTSNDAPVWKELEPWPGPARILPVVVAQEGSVFVISGADLAPAADGTARRTYLTDGYRFTPWQGWRAIAPSPKPLVAAASVAFGPSSVLAFSGDDGSLVDRNAELGDDHPGFPSDVWSYNTVTDTWSKASDMPDAVVTTGAVVWNGRIVIPGGEDRPGHRTAEVQAAVADHAARKGMVAMDYAVMGVYFAFLVVIGFYFSKREKTSADYFLGGKRVPWWAAGISIFGTLLSAITFLAVPATSFRTDWVYFVGNAAVIFVAPIIVYAYLPFFRRLDITTAYEYLEKRFNYAVRLFGSAAFLLFQLGRVGVVLYLPALALSTATGLDVRLAIVVMGVLCTLYTVLGGIEAVIWTDLLQVFVLLGGALLSLIVIGMNVEGGFSEVISQGIADDKFRVANWSWDYTMAAFWVVLIGRTLENMIPYTTDQTVVQRYLTTPTEKDAARSIWLGTLMSIPSAILFFGVGTALYAFYKGHPQMLDPSLATDAIFPLFIIEQLPAGVSGLVIAAVFAAAMSSLDSSLNSVAAVVVTDFYRPLVQNANEKTAFNLARWITIFIGVLGTGTALLMTFMEDIGSLWEHYMKLIGLFGGGLAGLFALGIFTRRATGAGALVGAAVGGVVLFFVQSQSNISFLLYSTVGIVTSFTVGYLASFVIGKNKDLAGLTWSTRSH